MRVLNLYTTFGCHLCELVEQMLQAQRPEQDIMVELVEISESDALMQAYAERIPVLKFDDAETELDWPFSEQELKTYLSVKQGD